MASGNQETIGITLLNLGGPDSLGAVQPFLFNLFSDRDIIRLGPSFLQKPIAWSISRLRSKKTKEMYSRIGGKSPILDITKAQANALEKVLNDEAGTGRNGETEIRNVSESPVHRFSGSKFKVYIGMRYWHPFIKDIIPEIIDDGIKRLIVLSLYPHYSKATTGSAVADFKQTISNFQTPNSKLQIQYIEQWPDFPGYIDAVAELIAEGLSEFKGSDYDVLYSAHSLPRSFIEEGDPYLNHIKLTINKVNERLSLDPYNLTGFKWRLSFQSKTGPVKWLEPSTDKTIINLSKSGCKHLFVVPVSFVSDHIETLYEIDILYRGLAEKHGIVLKRCRALNTSEKFILAMRDLIMKKVESRKE